LLINNIMLIVTINDILYTLSKDVQSDSYDNIFRNNEKILFIRHTIIYIRLLSYTSDYYKWRDNVFFILFKCIELALRKIVYQPDFKNIFNEFVGKKIGSNNDINTSSSGRKILYVSELIDNEFVKAIGSYNIF